MFYVVVVVVVFKREAKGRSGGKTSGPVACNWACNGLR